MRWLWTGFASFSDAHKRSVEVEAPAARWEMSRVLIATPPRRRNSRRSRCRGQFGEASGTPGRLNGTSRCPLAHPCRVPFVSLVAFSRAASNPARIPTYDRSGRAKGVPKIVGCAVVLPVIGLALKNLEPRALTDTGTKFPGAPAKYVLSPFMHYSKSGRWCCSSSGPDPVGYRVLQSLHVRRFRIDWKDSFPLPILAVPLCGPATAVGHRSLPCSERKASCNAACPLTAIMYH